MKACYRFVAADFSRNGDFHFVVKRDNGAVFTWYDLQGNASINAPHRQTNYDHWGISPWTQALIEDLAGIRSKGKLFDDVVCSPKWASTGVKKSAATAHFPASNTYFAYIYDQSGRKTEIFFYRHRQTGIFPYIVTVRNTMRNN